MNTPPPKPELLVELNQVASLGDQKYPSFELRVILNFLRAQGNSAWCDQLLGDIGLTEGDLEKPFITAHQALNALTNIMDAFYRPGLGHDVALTYRLEDLGAIGSCISCAATLGEALSIANTYYDLIGSFNDIANISNSETYTQRLVNVARIDPRIMRFLFELTVSGCSSLGEKLTGKKLPLIRVNFEDELSEQEKTFYTSLYCTEIRDRSRFNEWVVGQKILSSPLLGAGVTPYQFASDLKSLLHHLREDQGLVDDIDCILKGSAGDFPDPEMLSNALGISPRTLRRRLNKIGTSYSALIDKVRCQLAITLIQNENLSNEELAEELGYSDAANFCNAFKKWTGRTPSHYRMLQ